MSVLPFDQLLAFFCIAVLLALAPGPDNLFVLTQAALYGRSAGLSITLGLCTGLLVHTTAVALGVAALVHASAIAFSVLKLAGAGYLLWLAWQAWHAPAAAPVSGVSMGVVHGRLYRRGILMNLSNPKVSLFFLAFLPQFSSPHYGAMTPQLLLLGGVFIAATVLVFGVIALLAGALGPWLQRTPWVQAWFNRGVAVMFVGLALHLLRAERA